ncbi:GNAT family N-acetyltransferase [Fulvivirga sp. 29W222]|uniref:GNAT family N-acetyltransferase n=1 Tax=Fulvivirga marina TaxID=2494733 RepID=A0A937KFE0_9BACT|nr:GNAT family protein [Fulvivirga marina]MBL6448160.1 GNAT family N-acetyltransferase [Fulvivirga marina]
MTPTSGQSSFPKGQKKTDALLIESERLIIRNLQVNDLKNFLNYRTDPEVCRYQDWEVLNDEFARNFIDEQQHKSLDDLDEWIQLGIELKSEKQLIGDCAIKRHDRNGSIVEIGYAISPAYQRRGYAHEAVNQLIRHLFTEHGVHRITARLDPRNESSLALLNRLNFTQEGHFRKCFYDEFDKDWVDEIMFALLKEDYPI